MFKKLLFLVLGICFCSKFIQAQQAGQSAFSSLKLVSSPKISALGGELISSSGIQLDFAFSNPALMISDYQDDLSLNWSFHFAGVKYGATRYAFDTKKLGTIALGLNFVNYGTFIAADNSGQQTGEFKAGDYILNGVWSYELKENTRIGIMPQLAYSYIEDYTAVAFAINFGLHHHLEEKDLDLAFVVKQFGTEILAYDNVREKLPLDIQIGVSKKLEHAPFRWHITMHNLQRPDLSYDDPNLYSRDPISGEIVKKSVKLGDKIFRHAIIGLELFPDANFNVQIGYNHRRKQEMKRELYGRTVGWSWGVQMKFKRFEIQYARAAHHLVGGTNQLGISTNFQKF